MVRRPVRVKASTRLSVKPLDAANGMMDRSADNVDNVDIFWGNFHVPRWQRNRKRALTVLIIVTLLFIAFAMNLALAKAKERKQGEEETDFMKKKLADHLKVANIESKFSTTYDAVEQEIKNA